MSQLIKEVQAAEEEVLLGNIILYPTDTVWGIGCDAENGQAVRKIFEIKEREETKAMILLVADQEMLQRYVKELPEDFEQLLSQQERPTTYVFSEPQNLPREVLADDGSVAIRVVEQDEFCRRLLRQVGRPIVSTSANISGETAPKAFADISEAIKKRVDFVVNWRQDEEMASRPSRIVKIEPDGRHSIIRE